MSADEEKAPRGLGSVFEEGPAPSSLLAEALTKFPRTDSGILKEIENARLSNGHYSAIGQVAQAWAYFEAIVDTWLSALLNRPFPMVVCLTGQLIGPRGRIDGFIALVRVLGSRAKWNDDLEDIAKRVTGLAEQRNRAVHDLWDLTSPATPIRREATAKRHVRVLDVPVPTHELLELKDSIYQLANEFDDMASSIFTELHSSPGKWPPEHLFADRRDHPPDKSSLEPETSPESSDP
jgi:hypothetical protein